MRRLARSARSFLPAHLSMAQLRESAAGCTGYHLYKHATQTVFGEGAVRASVMFVGEQPGDQEDLAGRPFVGPAGKIFDKAEKPGLLLRYLEVGREIITYRPLSNQ